MDTEPKKKRRYTEKRRQMSRDAARCRRSNEARIFTELASALPCNGVSQQLDKASIVRIVITYLKLQQLMSSGLQINDRPVSLTALDGKFDHFYMKALDGFLMIISKNGEIIYATENVVFHLGIAQVDMIGHSIFDLTHPCDHDDIRDLISNKRRHTVTMGVNSDARAHYDFFVRMKSNYLSKANFSTFKSASYRVVHCCGHTMPVNDNDALSCVVLTGQLIPHPSICDLNLDSHTFVTHHNVDMTITYCDKQIHSLLGYKLEQLIGKSLFLFHHALDGELLEKAFRTLFAKGQVVTGPYRFMAYGGGYSWLNTQATLVNNSSAADKSQRIICVNNVISNVEETDLILSEVQLLTVADESDSPTVQSVEITIKEDIDDDDDDDDDDGFADDDSSFDPAMYIGNRMQFSTEMIVQKFTRNISTSNLNTSGTAGGFAASEQSERFQLTNGQNHDSYVHSNHEPSGLQTVPSNNSLFNLLESLTEFEERAPWISMDDMTFDDGDFNTASSDSISESDSQLPSRSSGNVIFTSGNEDENGVFEVIGSHAEEGVNIHLASTLTQTDQPELSVSSSGPLAVSQQASAAGKYGLSTRNSILMNLLVAGKDVNYGYQLSSTSEDGPAPVELHHIVCSSHRVF